MKTYLLLKVSAGRFGLIDFCKEQGMRFEFRDGGSYERAIITEEQATILRLKCPIIALREMPIKEGYVPREWIMADLEKN